MLAVLREEQKPKAPPSALQMARRHRARRLVTYVMGGAVLLFGLGSLRVAWHERRAEPANSFSPQTQVAPVVTVAPAAPAAATSSAPLPQAVASALPAPRSSGAVLARALAEQAEQSFERRRYREAIEQASRAVEADPSEAGPYLLWARALVETGQRAEAKRVFSRCLEQATKGPKDECSPGIR
ncbi:MAG: septation ring formation regulator EzrA [Polyangiaceae bacterium]|nr:septation ring formation regulator EzrA [Polyangiaceae bacterium]